MAEEGSFGLKKDLCRGFPCIYFKIAAGINVLFFKYCAHKFDHRRFVGIFKERAADMMKHTDTDGDVIIPWPVGFTGIHIFIRTLPFCALAMEVIANVSLL